MAPTLHTHRYQITFYITNIDAQGINAVTSQHEGPGFLERASLTGVCMFSLCEPGFSSGQKHACLGS